MALNHPSCLIVGYFFFVAGFLAVGFFAVPQDAPFDLQAMKYPPLSVFSSKYHTIDIVSIN